MYFQRPFLPLHIYLTENLAILNNIDIFLPPSDSPVLDCGRWYRNDLFTLCSYSVIALVLNDPDLFPSFVQFLTSIYSLPYRLLFKHLIQLVQLFNI